MRQGTGIREQGTGNRKPGGDAGLFLWVRVDGGRSGKRQGGIGGKICRREFFRDEARPGCGGDHGGIVSGERERGEGDSQAATGGFFGEARAKFAVGGNSAGDENTAGSERLGCGEGLLEQVADDSVLKAGDQVERRL